MRTEPAMIDPVLPQPDDLLPARELAHREAEILNGGGADVGLVGDLLARVRSSGDAATIGRVLCLLSRAQGLQGQHEAALSTAYEGIRAFAQLDELTARRYAGAHAELFRAAGAALSKLGRIAHALPVLEQGIRIAQDAIDTPAPHGTVSTSENESIIAAPTALIRGLITLGTALLAIREIDAAIDVYYRALRTTTAYPATLEDLLVDTMLVRSALTGALHERVKRARSAGETEPAARDIAAAQLLLDADAWHVEQELPGGPATAHGPLGTLCGFSRAAYFAALGRHLLITDEPAKALATFERELEERRRLDDVYEWGVADAHAGMAQALLALERPSEALKSSVLAHHALDRHDESSTRATVLLLEADAHRAAGDHAAAYDALKRHHAVRAGLEAAAAQQYAMHMTAQLGLERARADAESPRGIAATLEALGEIGQEITANLDAVAVLQIFTRQVEVLLRVSAFTVWLLDAGAQRLMLAFGLQGGVAIAAADTAVDDAQSPAAQAVRERREVCATTAHGSIELFSPLIVGERILGVVSIQSDQPVAYDGRERSIFRTLCTYAAIALDNATAYAKLEQTVVALKEAQFELARQTAEFERLSMTDALTGVANRRYLHDRAQVEIAAVRRKAGSLSVAMFDIDHFKRVNDSYGHAAGDAVLQKIAQVAKEWLRPGDLIARVGGEEFALLLPGAGIRESVAVAERIRSSIAETVVIVGEASIRVTSSFGVATFDAACDTLEHALNRADRALYAAKIAGRDRVLATPSVCV
jgi:diguanylate cyclase (GGDEF)-like protein